MADKALDRMFKSDLPTGQTDLERLKNKIAAFDNNGDLDGVSLDVVIDFLNSVKFDTPLDEAPVLEFEGKAITLEKDGDNVNPDGTQKWKLVPREISGGGGGGDCNCSGWRIIRDVQTGQIVEIINDNTSLITLAPNPIESIEDTNYGNINNESNSIGSSSIVIEKTSTEHEISPTSSSQSIVNTSDSSSTQYVGSTSHTLKDEDENDASLLSSVNLDLKTNEHISETDSSGNSKSVGQDSFSSSGNTIIGNNNVITVIVESKDNSSLTKENTTLNVEQEITPKGQSDLSSGVIETKDEKFNVKEKDSQVEIVKAKDDYKKDIPAQNVTDKETVTNWKDVFNWGIDIVSSIVDAFTGNNKPKAVIGLENKNKKDPTKEADFDFIMTGGNSAVTSIYKSNNDNTMNEYKFADTGNLYGRSDFTSSGFKNNISTQFISQINATNQATVIAPKDYKGTMDKYNISFNVPQASEPGDGPFNPANLDLLNGKGFTMGLPIIVPESVDPNDAYDDLSLRLSRIFVVPYNPSSSTEFSKLFLGIPQASSVTGTKYSIALSPISFPTVFNFTAIKVLAASRFTDGYSTAFLTVSMANGQYLLSLSIGQLIGETYDNSFMGHALFDIGLKSPDDVIDLMIMNMKSSGSMVIINAVLLTDEDSYNIRLRYVCGNLHSTKVIDTVEITQNSTTDNVTENSCFITSAMNNYLPADNAKNNFEDGFGALRLICQQPTLDRVSRQNANDGDNAIAPEDLEPNLTFSSKIVSLVTQPGEGALTQDEICVLKDPRPITEPSTSSAPNVHLNNPNNVLITWNDVWGGVKKVCGFIWDHREEVAKLVQVGIQIGKSFAMDDKTGAPNPQVLSVDIKGCWKSTVKSSAITPTGKYAPPKESINLTPR